MKKIVYITQALGGVKTHIEYIINHINKKNFEIVLVAPSDTSLGKLCEKFNIIYYKLDFVRELHVYKDIKCFLQIIKILKREKPFLVHAHSAKGGFLGRLAAKICGDKVIYTPNGLAYLSFTGIKRNLYYHLEYWAKAWTTLFLAVSFSEANRAYFELGYDRENVKVVLNAVESNLPVSCKNNTTVKHIGMIARLTYQKNPLLFLQIAKKVLIKYPTLKFSILGGGIHDHLGDDVNNFIINNGLEDKVQIVAWGCSNTSDSYLEDVDIFLMTSAFEGLPYSLLEAMSKGIPCIVSVADGNSDVIKNGENGFSCLSIEEFYLRIEQLIESDSLRCHIGMNAINYIYSNHNIRKNILEVEKIYEAFI